MDLAVVTMSAFVNFTFGKHIFYIGFVFRDIASSQFTLVSKIKPIVIWLVAHLWLVFLYL